MRTHAPLTIALAQVESKKRNVTQNIEKHVQYIAEASRSFADYVVFPELSLTGYEPETAMELAFSLHDERIDEIRRACRIGNITAVVGAPISMRCGTAIGEFIIPPAGPVQLYTKRYLHPGEEKHFIPGNLNPVLADRGETICFAICADSNNPRHAEDAFNNSAGIYIVSALITPGGYDSDTAKMKNYAKTFGMDVLLVNYSGCSGGYESAGGSKVWDRDGCEAAEIRGNGEGLLVVRRNEFNKWTVAV